MGKASLDVDIALDDMLGKDFAERVNSYLKAHGQQTHHVAVIMSNPEQSKHLETARMKVRGLWIDLVNLRSEEYAHHSRIPTMEFGTPEQDAHRRDFTINAMFYNINEGTIEDFTKRGIQDLRDGIIRTPLPPKETFMDGKKKGKIGAKYRLFALEFSFNSIMFSFPFIYIHYIFLFLCAKIHCVCFVLCVSLLALVLNWKTLF